MFWRILSTRLAIRTSLAYIPLGATGGGRIDERNRQVAERLFEAIGTGDVERFHAQFHADSIIEFPQSGEQIVGEEQRRSVYRSFPGRPTVTRIRTGGNLVVVEADVDYGDDVDWRAVFVCQLRDGKIERLTAVWGAPFKAASSRAQSTEGRDRA
jgi:ketosteroid isomerase-like protein